MKAEKNYLIVFLIILIGNITWSQELIKSIPIEGKNITNLSGSINDSISFHIIINKIAKSYNSKVYFFSKEQEISNIDIYNSQDKPNYLVFHVNENTLTLFRERKDKKIAVQDINYLSGEMMESQVPFKSNQILSHRGMTFVVGHKMNVSYPLAFIKSASDTKINMITPEGNIDKTFFSFIDKNTEFVNDIQFLDNGPISDYKAFLYHEKLKVINDSKKNGAINIMTISSSGKIVNQKITVRNKKAIKRLSSFVKDSLLFSFKMYKEEAFLDIYDLESLDKLKTYNYTIDEFGPYNKVVSRGTDVTSSFDPKKVYKDFSPQAVGSLYLPALNVAVNKTIDNDYVIRIGHLDENSYNNKTTKNYWWNYDSFILNYNVNSGAFTMNSQGMQLMVFQALADAKNKGNYFELRLNQALEKSDNTINYKYHTIDENVYTSRLKNLMTLDRYFYVIQNDYVRFINYNKDDKSYNIYNVLLLK